jgi:hypothetical protein
MGLLDSLFNQSTYGGQGGGLLDFLRQSQMQQEQYQPSAGFPGQASPIGVGDYQMPRIGDQAQFTPQQSDPAALPTNAQPTQGQMPVQVVPQQPPAQQAQPQGLPPALGGSQGGFGAALRGFANNAHAGPIGALIGAIGNGMGATSPAQQNLKAQYDSLIGIGLSPQKAMLAVMNPEAGKTILAQALDRKQFGFTKMDDGTIIRTDPLTGKADLAYGGGDANKTGVAGPDGKIIPYPEGLDAAGRKTFANEIARINADAAGGKKTEVQAKSEKFANLMEVAEKNLKGIEGEGLSLSGKTLGALPGGVGNYGQSSNFQKYTQAKNKFITSLLRDESGAAIGTQEFTRYERELFPQPGDGPEVIAQKAENRKAAIDAMKKSAGPGYKAPEAPATAATPSVQEGATATNPQTGQKLTFRNGKWQ